MVSAINFKQMPLVSVFKGCDVVSGLAYFLLINLSSQSQIDDILFAGDNIYLNSFCFKKKRLFISGCTGASLLRVDLLQLRCMGLSLRGISRRRGRLWVLRLQWLWCVGSRVRLRSCGGWLLCGAWSLPQPGIEPVSPVLAGGFLTSRPLGKPLVIERPSHGRHTFLRW